MKGTKSVTVGLAFAFALCAPVPAASTVIYVSPNTGRVPGGKPVGEGDLVKVCPGQDPAGLESTLRGIPQQNCRYYRLNGHLVAVGLPDSEAEALREREWQAYVVCGESARACNDLRNDLTGLMDAALRKVDELFGSAKPEGGAINPDISSSNDPAAQICRSDNPPGSPGFQQCMESLAAFSTPAPSFAAPTVPPSSGSQGAMPLTNNAGDPYVDDVHRRAMQSISDTNAILTQSALGRADKRSPPATSVQGSGLNLDEYCKGTAGTIFSLPGDTCYAHQHK